MSSSKKTTQSVDEQTRNLGLFNYQKAQDFASTPYQAFDPNSISKFESPYTNDVVNAALSDLNRAREMGILNNDQNATTSHAFGGSRHGVADALTNEAFLRTAANTSATLRDQAYNNASGLAQADWNASRQDPLQKLGILGSIYGSSVLPSATTTNKTSSSGLGNILGSILSVAQTASGMGWAPFSSGAGAGFSPLSSTLSSNAGYPMSSIPSYVPRTI